MFESAQLIEDAAQRPDITLVVVGLLLAELRGQIVRGADDGVREVCGLVEELGHTQVSDFDLVLSSEEHVYGLDVSVEYFVRVQVLNSEAHLKEELPNTLLCEGLSHLLLEVETEVAILAELHDNVDVRLLGEAVVVLDYVGAIDAR